MVAVRIRAAGVDPSIWHLMTGRPYLIRLMGLGFSKPKMPAGWDGAGVVDSVGSGVTRFKPGDEVFGSSGMTGTGTFAEFALLPEESCAPKPANLTLEEAAALPVSGCTALQAVRDVGAIAAGAQVLVIGAGGGVGHFAMLRDGALGRMNGQTAPTVALARAAKASTRFSPGRDRGAITLALVSAHY
ncbi:MAG: NAD(P)-dependent alcohol dehydrogenase [Polyangiaceae bacterium]|jgi:NADPH:quinone reductase-like Zn-dependent oxidoreductase